ncbi:hypothetical protein [Chitinophaga sp. YIM B06452]|uniref:hypothetical protein n=1 Tax=Chitinophaga sp. YIM B06452 TaxID=3082158 RepID=UPI0031FEC76B
MIIFLVLTLVFWLAVAGFTLMLWISIQPGNWLGSWQKQLRKWDLAGKELLYRVLGGCGICTAHAIAQLSFPVYVAFLLFADAWPLGWLASLLWYGVYVSVATNLNLFFITKLFK